MAEQAKTGVQEFLDFCKALVSAQLAQSTGLEVLETAASDVSDEFFDAQQEVEIDLSWEPRDAGALLPEDVLFFDLARCSWRTLFLLQFAELQIVSRTVSCRDHHYVSKLSGGACVGLYLSLGK